MKPLPKMKPSETMGFAEYWEKIGYRNKCVFCDETVYDVYIKECELNEKPRFWHISCYDEKSELGDEVWDARELLSKKGFKITKK